MDRRLMEATAPAPSPAGASRRLERLLSRSNLKGTNAVVRGGARPSLVDNGAGVVPPSAALDGPGGPFVVRGLWA